MAVGPAAVVALEEEGVLLAAVAAAEALPVEPAGPTFIRPCMTLEF